MTQSQIRPRRSVLYTPAANDRALSKIGRLSCDVIVIDLEDSVAPSEKAAARQKLATIFSARPQHVEMAVRINALSGTWGADDLAAAISCKPDAILLPKVKTPHDILEAGKLLDRADKDMKIALWAMIETPKGLLNSATIAELGCDPASRLTCFVAGTNDLAKETGVTLADDRRYFLPWLMQMVLAARAGGLDLIDGVYNDFYDVEGFARECRQAANMGFDGKSLIHPAQIEAANIAFAPSAEALVEARAIVDIFARSENQKKGVVALNGRMVERLHLAQAKKCLAKATAVNRK
ncbi:HpcH/HpaI aldolase/citrate lyase family protein [Aquamicrobium segne]|uniref:HpcH/HpaI aldolase/citrate lyase family protein n=1 Tax=Aquamicrobium segne TaxID=469547 RepID=A0ABW0H140_9HYPH